jgi:hypothetical protein
MQEIINFIEGLRATHGATWIIGQIFGIIAIIFGFISYQVRTQRQILIMQSTVAVFFGIHYLLIGAYSGMIMNFINIPRNFFYDRRTQKGSKSEILPTIFVAIQASMCVLTWEAWYSIFVLLGIGINTYCMSFSNPQNVRKSILVTSPLVLTYDIFARSIGGSIYETVALVSAFIGILRNRKANNP